MTWAMASLAAARRHAGSTPPVARACGLGALAIGLAVLAGWAADVEPLTRISSGLAPMAPSTAVMLVLCGFAVALLRDPREFPRQLVACAAAGTLGLAAVAFAERALDQDFGIDSALFGGTAPHGLSVLVLAAAAAAVLLLRRTGKGSSTLADAAVLATGLLALLALAAELLGVSGLSGSTGMAVPTVAGLALLAAGVIAAAPQAAPARWFGAADTAARRELPLLLAAPLALGWLALRGVDRGLFDAELAVALLVVAFIATLAALAVRLGGAADREQDWSEALEQRFVALAAQAPVGIFETSPMGGFTAVNDRWSEIAGLRADYAMGTGWATAVHPEDRPRVVARWAEASRSGLPFEDAFRFSHPDESVRWVRTSARPFLRSSGGIQGWIGTCLDISDAHHREAELTRAEERFETAIDQAPIGMGLVSPIGRWIRVNRSLCDMTGFAEGELLAKSVTDISHPDDLDIELDHVRRVLDGEEQSYTLEKRCFRSDGHTIWMLVSASLVRDREDHPQHFVVQMQDITERKRYERDLEDIADHDPLTGLFSRRRLTHELEREIARSARSGHSAALLMIDLDNFKEVNDSLGHRVGDEVIRAVAVALRTRLRSTDFIARLGGDEFAVLLPETNAETAQAVATTLVDEIRRTTVTMGDGRKVHVTASAGVAPLEAGDEQSDEGLLIAAEVAMYEAKEAGRDRLAVHRVSDGGAERAGERLNWSDRIRRALDEDLFVLHFQPIADLGNGRVDRYEALIRLADEPGGAPIGPNLFLPIADRYGLMPAIDRWVVASAIRTLADESVPKHISLEVNLSARSLSEEALLQLIERETAIHDIDPRRLIFEVTETTAVTNIEEAKLFARRLTRLGCSFALDDFGTGFASLHQVKHLPYRYVKIDGDFIRAITHSPNDRLMVQALVDVATGMQKRTIAEFVGDIETYDLLHELGVDYAQGFFIGRPEPLHDALSTGASFTAEFGRGPRLVRESA